MAKRRWFQRSFNGGVWSEATFGRNDLQAYPSAVRLCRNFVPKIAGSASVRPGSMFVAAAKDGTKQVRLFEYVFNLANAYVLEVGDQYVRFYKNDARIENPPGTPVELTTPWLEADLFDLQLAYDADTLVFTHPDYQPRVIQRTDDTTWSIDTLDFKYGPYLSKNEVEPGVYAFKTGTTFFAKLTNTGGVPVEFRSAPATRTVTADGNVFEAGRDEGRLLVVGNGDATETFAVGTINTVSSPTSATVDFFDGNTGGAAMVATSNWWMQAYYESSSKSRWPACCTFAQQRLFLGGGASGSDLIHGSRLGDFTDFDFWAYADFDPPATTVNDDQHQILDTSGILIELSYPEVTELRWLRGSRRSLVAGTSRLIFSITPPQTEGFTPLATLDVSPTSATGSDTLPALALKERIHFVASSRRRLTRISYSITEDAFVPADLSQLNEDILLPGVRDSAVAYYPEPILWFAIDDGRLVGCTLDEASNVIAWHDHLLGGVGVAQDWAEVESVAVIPASDASYEQLWLVVRRTIEIVGGGTEQRYIERLDRRMEEGDDRVDQRFVDSRGAAYDGIPTTTYSVGDHLQNLGVDVLADGGEVAPKTVDGSGGITLDEPASKIVAGLQYTRNLRSLPMADGSRYGIPIGEKHRFVDVVLRLVRSMGGRVGVGPAGRPRFQGIDTRRPEDPINEPPPLFSGLLHVPVRGEASIDPAIEIQHVGPTHLEVSLWGGTYDVSDVGEG